MNETSLSIFSSIKSEIRQLSLASGKSCNFICKHLISQVINCHNYASIQTGLIDYQKKFDTDFKVLRYRLTDQEHISFHLARIRLKTSISKLLLIGFLLFFKKLVKKLTQKNKHKKFNNNYTIIYQKAFYQLNDFLKKVEKIQKE